MVARRKSWFKEQAVLGIFKEPVVGVDQLPEGKSEPVPPRPLSKSHRLREALTSVFTWGQVTVTEDLSLDSSVPSSDAETPPSLQGTPPPLLSESSLQQDPHEQEPLPWNAPDSRIGLADFALFQAQARIIKQRMDDYPLYYPWSVWLGTDHAPTNTLVKRKLRLERTLDTNLDVETLIFTYKESLPQLQPSLHIFKLCSHPSEILSPAFGGSVVMQVEAATGHRFWRALLQVLVGEGMVGCALWGVHGLSWKGCGETANISVRLVASAVLTPTTVRTWCDTLCEALPDAARESLETARFVDPERLVYIMYALSSSSMPRL